MFFDSDDEDEFEEFLLRTIRLGVSDEDVRDSADAKIERFDDEAFVKLFEDDHIAKHVFKYFTAQAQARFRLVNSHCYHLLQSNDSSNDGMWLFLLEQHTAVANTCRKILYDPPAKKDYHPMFHSAANIYRVAYTFSKRRNKCALCYQNLLPHSLFSFLTSSHDRRGISSRYCNKCVGTRVMPFAQAADMYYLSLSESSKFWINGYSSFIEEREILNYFSKEFPDVDELQRRQTNYENQYLKTIRNKNAVETQYRKKLEQIMVEKGLDPVEAHSTALAAKFFSNKLRNDPEVNGEDIAKEILRRREMISLFKETVKSFMSPNSEFVITDSHLHSVSGITRSYISSQIEANDADNLEVAKAEIVRYAKQILGKDGPTSGTTNLEEHDKRLQQMTNGEFTLQTMQQCQHTYEHFFSMCKYGVKVSDEKMQEAIKAAKREMRIEQELKENNYNMKYMELPNSVINYIRFCVMSRRKTTSTFYQVISKILRTYANLTNNSKLLHSCMNKLDTAGKLDVVIFSLKCRTNCVLKAGDPQPTSSDNAMTDDNGATIPPIAVEETKDENALAFIEELSNLLDKYKTTKSNVPKELLDTIAASLFKPIADDSYFYPRSLVINYFIENYVRVRGSNGALKSYGVDQPEAAEVVDEIVIEPESESESEPEPEPEPEPERLNRRRKREYDEAEYHLNRKEQNEFEKLPDDEGIARSRPQRKRRKFSETSKHV